MWGRAILTRLLSPESPRAPSSGQHSDSHGESSAELEEQDQSGPQAAQCLAQVLPGEGAPRAPHTPLVLRLALPQASASGSEDTVAKAKQSRSEKKARKVCWGPAPLGRSQAGQTTHPLRTLPTRGWRIPSLGALRRMQ